MYSDTQPHHDNMFINFVSNVIAFTVGCFAALQHNEFSFLSIGSIQNAPEILDLLLRSAIGGVVGFLFKVGGDYALHILKNRKKGGKGE